MLTYLLTLTIVFFPQIFIGAFIFSLQLKRKDNFFPKFCFLLFAGYIGSALFLMLLYYIGIWILSNFLYYIIVFFISMWLLHLLFDEGIKAIFLCAASGYLVQHISYQITSIVRETFFYQLDTSIPKDAVYILLIQLPVFVSIYALSYEFFAKKLHRLEFKTKTEDRLIFLSFVIILTVWLFSGIRDYYSNESFALSIISRMFSALCCLLLLYIRTYMVDISKRENERLMMEQLYYEQQRQYEINKETIDLINEKCHDMRHQLRNMDAGISRNELNDLINIYDDTIHTENSTLNTIFAEKSILCQKYGIRLSPMIDGSLIAFMEIADIYSLFGNILENAIEAVSKLNNKDDRIISIKVQQKANMVLISTDNYYVGNISFNNGLPSTSKSDRDYHGFGMQSVKRIVKKYGGTLTINADEMFHLMIMIPML